MVYADLTVRSLSQQAVTFEHNPNFLLLHLTALPDQELIRFHVYHLLTDYFQ